MEEDSLQGIWYHIAEKMLLEFAESGCPTFRATTRSPEVNSKAKDVESCRYTSRQMNTQLRQFLSVSSVFTEQSQRYVKSTNPFTRDGATCCDGTIKFVTRAQCDQVRSSFGLWWPSVFKNFQLQQYEERIEKLTQQDILSKFCMDAGFLSVVEIGQYFMTKDTGDLTQFSTVACCEYTLPREEEAPQPKGCIRRHTEDGPVLEVATSYLHGKHGVEGRIMSLSRDNTHSWVRISHGSNRLVMNLNNNTREIPEDQLEEFALKQNAKRFCMPIEGKSKTAMKRTCWLFTENRSLWKNELDRYWTREIFFLRMRSRRK